MYKSFILQLILTKGNNMKIKIKLFLQILGNIT